MTTIAIILLLLTLYVVLREFGAQNDEQRRRAGLPAPTRRYSKTVV
jgi:hypothetical protein